MGYLPYQLASRISAINSIINMKNRSKNPVHSTLPDHVNRQPSAAVPRSSTWSFSSQCSNWSRKEWWITLPKWSMFLQHLYKGSDFNLYLHSPSSTWNPENDGFPREIYSRVPFSGSMWNFGRVKTSRWVEGVQIAEDIGFLLKVWGLRTSLRVIIVVGRGTCSRFLKYVW